MLHSSVTIQIAPVEQAMQFRALLHHEAEWRETNGKL